MFLLFGLALVILSPRRAAAAWPTDPLVNVPICTAVGDQLFPSMVADGVGGAIVVWQDERGGGDSVYAQHVLVGGTVDPAWPADGRVLCGSGHQYYPVTVSDGVGGAIVAWQDDRSGRGSDVYAQRVLANGTVDPAWPSDGAALCTASGDQLFPAIAVDGAGGAIVAWVSRSGTGEYDIYAEHVLAGGEVDSLWLPDGRPVCTVAGGQVLATIIADGIGGAIISWQDDRNGVVAFYSQHVQASGELDPAWPVDGAPQPADPRGQRIPTIVVDGAGGAVVTWQGKSIDGSFDIYAQHVLDSGEPDPAWPADGRVVCADASEQHSPTIVESSNGDAIIAWQDGRNSNIDIYAQRVQANGQLGSSVVSVRGEVSLELALDPARPNPLRGGSLTVHFTLASPAPASLELLDVAGRCVASSEVGPLGAGRHSLDLGAGRHLAPGLYLLRLRQGVSLRVTRVVVLD